MIILPLFGALLESIGTLTEKGLLKNKSLSSNTYASFSFLAIVTVMLPFVYFFWKVNKGYGEIVNLSIFALVILAAVFANLLVYYALKREKISEFEPIWMMQPLFTVILAFIIYGAEGKMATFVLALIASAALIAAHIKKHHIYFDKYSIALLLGCFLFAVELVASKTILDYYSPLTFYFIRCLFVALIMFIAFRPGTKGISKKNIFYILAVGTLWVVYRTIMYYGYLSSGIIFTTMMFILAPVFLLIFAAVFLREKMSVRQIICTCIILICVAISVYLNSY